MAMRSKPKRWNANAGSDAQSDNQRRDAKHDRHFAALRKPLFRAGVQQHDHEDKQHHHRASINNDLHCRDELRAQQQIDERQRAHHHDERERAVDRVLLHQEVDRPSHTQRRENEEKNESEHWVEPAVRPASTAFLGCELAMVISITIASSEKLLAKQTRR